MKNKKTYATLAALGVQVIFGFSFMFTKIALGFATPMTVIANRYMVAFLGLTVEAIISTVMIIVDIWGVQMLSVKNKC